jgi:hypothetical protein
MVIYVTYMVYDSRTVITMIIHGYMCCSMEPWVGAKPQPAPIPFNTMNKLKYNAIHIPYKE